MNLDLGSILSQTADTIGALGSTADSILGINNDRMEIAKSEQDEARKTAAAASTKATLDLQTVADQESRRKAIAARLGTDSTSAGWIIGQSADEMVAAKKQADAANEKIRMKEGISFIDNPMGYLLGKMTVGADYADYNYWATKYNNSEKLAKDVESMGQQAFITSNALTSTVTQAYIQASQVLGMHQYVKEGMDAAANGARWNMEGIIAASNLRKDQLGLMYNANSAQMQEKQYQVAMAHLSLSKQQFNLQKAAADEKMSEDSYVIKTLAAGYFALNGKQMDPLKAKEALVMFKGKNPQVLEWFNSGIDSNAVGKPVIALSPYDSTSLYMNNRVQNISPDQKVVLDQLSTWRREFENRPPQAMMGVDKNDKNATERAFNLYVQQQQRLITGNVTYDSIFAPARMKQTASLNKNIGALPLWNTVLKPAAESGINVDDPNIAMGLISAALESKKISYADALDYTAINQAGLAINNQSKNFISVGMPAVNTYRTQVQLSGQYGKEPVNLADGKELARVLNKIEAASTLSRMQTDYGRGNMIPR